MTYPRLLRYTPRRFWVSLTLLLAASAFLVACAGAVSTDGVRLRVGPGPANEAIADLDAGAVSRGEDPMDSGFDWSGLFDVLGKAALGAGGLGTILFGGHKVIKTVAVNQVTKAPWSAEEKQDIKDLAAGKTVA